MTIAEKILRAKYDYDEVYEAGRQAGIASLNFVTVDSGAYITSVPNNALAEAQVKRIGGMSYKTKNLLRYPYSYTTQTIGGITFTDNGDGSITLDGTNDGTRHSAFFLYSVDNPINLPAGTYRGAIANDSTGQIVMQCYDGTTYYSPLQKEMTITESTPFRIYIQVSKNNPATFSNVRIYPMFNKGSTALPYEPYFEGLRSASVSELKSDGVNGAIDTLIIPEAIRNLDGYGLGINSTYYNYIDFDRKVFVQNVYRKVFNGTENWVAAASSTSDKKRVALSKTVAWDGKFPIVVSTANDIAPIISSIYKTVTANDTWVNVNGICINSNSELMIYDEEYNTSDISLWKSHLAELYASGNPLIIDYALATPIETNISTYITDEYIQVEGGGIIIAVNEHKLDVPTRMYYLIAN